MECPKCQGEIVDNGAFFKCENSEQKQNEETKEWEEVGTCTFKVWKSCFSRFGGPELTLEVLEKVLVEGEAEVELVAKGSGKPYPAIIIPDEEYVIKVDFDRFKKKEG